LRPFDKLRDRVGPGQSEAPAPLPQP
jgi:hypothetical protein